MQEKNTNNIDYKAIGKAIRSLRISKNMTQEELARSLNLSVSHIRNMESSNAKISLSTLIKLANIFNVSTDLILHDSLKNKEIANGDMYLESIKDCDEKQLKIIIETIKTLKAQLNENL